MGHRLRFITGSLGNIGPTLPFPSPGLSLLFKKQGLGLRSPLRSPSAERLDSSLELPALQ